MTTLIHAADLHLDSPLNHLETRDGDTAETLRGASRKAVDHLVDLTLSAAAEVLVIAGDLFDGDWRDYHAGLWLVRRMGRLRDAGVRIFVVTGNHDAAGRITKSLRWPDNVHVFRSDKPDTVILEHLGLAIHGQGFARPAVTQNLAAGFPAPVPGLFNLGLLHTSATGREGHLPYAPCDPSDLVAKGYDYWALGHVHRHEILSREPWIVFSGNLQGRHARETGPKGAMRVRMEHGSPVMAEFHALDAVRWEAPEVDVSPARDADEALALVRDRLEDMAADADRPLVVRVMLTGRSPAHADLAADPEHWTAQLRADLLASLGDRVRLETLRPARSFQGGIGQEGSGVPMPAAADGESPMSDGPWADIAAVIEEALADADMAASLFAPVEELARKLPRETADLGPDAGLDLGDPAPRRELLESAGDLLRRRLMEGIL